MIETQYLEFQAQSCELKISTFNETHGSEILDSDEQSKLLEFSRVEDLADIIIKKLKTIVAPRAVVSSYNETGIATSYISGRPHAFIIHPMFIQMHMAHVDGMMTFPCHDSLCKGMALINFELIPCNSAIYEMLKKLQSIHRRTQKYHKVVSSTKGALAFNRGMCLITYSGAAAAAMYTQPPMSDGMQEGAFDSWLIFSLNGLQRRFLRSSCASWTYDCVVTRSAVSGLATWALFSKCAHGQEVPPWP